ncbi:putative membrane protein [Asticcacaulis biprosthecium C19]|uniref:Putative membrane protein n=1 Tax=Asticcacaulis biprosthecium C19 TaxID=715226 RepID=F4QK58_9CAUL|nr:hypothetical protein [Asticcacaulis biprosthecium]EGF92085.1 putative membrane protein [Asticcacaulis biprosthecium C19]
MSDNLGGDAVQFGFALWDAARASLVGLNPIPVLITSAFFGIVQPQRGWYIFKALVALVPAVLMVALWPVTQGYTPIWPDVTQMETQIQLLTMLMIAWLIIRLLYMVKATLTLGTREPEARTNGH